MWPSRAPVMLVAVTFECLDLREHTFLKRTRRLLSKIGCLVSSSPESIVLRVSGHVASVDGDIAKWLVCLRPRRLRLESSTAFPDAYGSRTHPTT
jgi:hypothetical protein